MTWEITEAEYERALATTGRYCNPPGWYFLGEDGPEGPYASREAAEADEPQEKS